MTRAAATRRRLPALLAAALPALALTGCVSFGAKPPPSLLRMTPAETVPVGAPATLSAGNAVTVMIPATPAEIATNRVPVRTGQTAVAYIKNAQWEDMPARLFRDLLAETIRARTGRPVLASRDYHLAPGLRLMGQIKQFGLDAPSKTVVMVYDATLEREDKQIVTQRFEARAPAGAATSDGVGPALNTVANQVAQQVADWVGR
jgi:cholesterol transport system auxiliary component